jgi:hypothetical protein
VAKLPDSVISNLFIVKRRLAECVERATAMEFRIFDRVIINPRAPLRSNSMISPSIQVFGYHGTSKQKASIILLQGFRISDKDYDWLGEGVYFFQDAPYRAMQWATQQYPQDPAVIRALIQLDNCIAVKNTRLISDCQLVEVNGEN